MNQAFPSPPTLRRVLIIKPSSLGDVATALPLLCDLKRVYPAAKIDWLVHPALRAMVEGHDALNAAVLFDRKLFARSWRSLRAVRGLHGLASQLRNARYDCVIDAQGLLRSGLLTRVAAAPIRIGFEDAREGASLFYTHRVPIARGDAVSTVRMRSLLAPLGIEPTWPAEFRMPVRAEARAGIAARLPAENVVGMIPGTRGREKRWSPAGYVTIIQRLHAARRHTVLLGSPDERELCEKILNDSGCPGTNLAGRTSMAELIAALDRCEVVVGNDTGPLHAAAALGKPVVGLYGPTDPRSVGPYGQLDRVVRFEPSGRGLELDDFQSYRRSQETVEAVWERVKGLLPVSA